MEKCDFFHIYRSLMHCGAISYRIRSAHNGMNLGLAGRLQDPWVQALTNSDQAALYCVFTRGAVRRVLSQEQQPATACDRGAITFTLVCAPTRRGIFAPPVAGS